MKLLQAESISLNISGRQVLQEISLEISSKEIVTIIGPNGAGKTTLLKVLLGLLKPTTGNVIRKKHLRIGYLPQNISVSSIMPLSVARMMTLTVAKSHSEVLEALDKTGVGYLLDSQVSSLSGGELQRVMLARTLLSNPELLVLDEPVQSVDYLGETEMYKLIGKLKSEYECAVLMISHDLHVVMAATDRVICLDQHICCQGHPNSVTQHPEYVRLFGEEGDGTLTTYEHRHDHKVSTQLTTGGLGERNTIISSKL